MMSTSSEKPNPGEFLTGGLVKVVVGPLGVVFDVHRKLLCAHSKNLTEALFDKSNNTLVLSEFDPTLLQFVIHKFYTGNSGDSLLPPTTDGIRASIQLYVLAVKLQIRPSSVISGRPSKNSFLDVIKGDLRDSKTFLNYHEINYIYRFQNLSRLRQFASNLTIFALRSRGHTVQDYQDSFIRSPAFSMDICNGFLNILTPIDKLEDPREIPEPRSSEPPSSNQNKDSTAASPMSTAPPAPVARVLSPSNTQSIFGKPFTSQDTETAAPGFSTIKSIFEKHLDSQSTATFISNSPSTSSPFGKPLSSEAATTPPSFSHFKSSPASTPTTSPTTFPVSPAPRVDPIITKFAELSESMPSSSTTAEPSASLSTPTSTPTKEPKESCQHISSLPENKRSSPEETRLRQDKLFDLGASASPATKRQFPDSPDADRPGKRVA